MISVILQVFDITYLYKSYISYPGADYLWLWPGDLRMRPSILNPLCARHTY